jgi:hypothetical protein
MSGQTPTPDDFWALLNAACDGNLDETQIRELAALMDSDPTARKTFIDHVQLLTDIRFLCRVERASEDTLAQVRATLPQESPPFAFLGSTSQATVGYAFHAWSLAYLAAAVILGVGLFIGSFIHVPRAENVANNALPSAPSVPNPQTEVVGLITGMVDCRWDEPKIRVFDREHVSLGRTYALASGFMEITYASGARVILQGPARYEVESARGGYLAFGKLTARIEKPGKKSGAKGERTANPTLSRSGIEPAASLALRPSSVERRESSVENREESVSPTSPSQLSTLNSGLFAVRTPTAVVTDLGTEFGVEVSKEGNTTSYVFRGAASVRLGDGSRPQGKRREVILHENEAVSVERGEGLRGPRFVGRTVAADSRAFVRRLGAPPKWLDVLDIVAGGNGTGGRRERGIDPSTGLEDPLAVTNWRDGNGQYHAVTWHPLIDGVFVPDGGSAPVQVDSAGHTFDGFPHTEAKTWGSIWPRGPDVAPKERAGDPLNWVYAMGRGQEFMPKGRGLLALNSNSGITLDLEAMRAMYWGTRPARFRATVGMADAHRVFPDVSAGLADVWVFVDGRLKLKRLHLRPQDGTTNVDVELGPSDRFLTLATTDGGDGINCDWVVIGDPVLEMTETSTNPQRKEAPKHRE